MPSPALRRNLGFAFGIALIVGGVLHGSGYATVVPLVRNVDNDVKVIFPALWVGFAWHYLIFGLLALSAARSRPLLGLLTVVPLVDGITQVVYFGYSPSEIVLFTIAALGTAATLAHRDAVPTAR